MTLQPTFGLSKGGRGAYLDQSGTAFDQSQLMVELLREAANNGANVSNIRYEFGTVTLATDDAQSWFGVDDAAQLCETLANGGIPAACSSGGGNVTLEHVWVSANVDGASVEYDPSLKRTKKYDVHTAIAAFETAYPSCVSSAAFSTASSTAIPDGDASSISLKQFNYDGLTSDLDTCADAFYSFIETAAPMASVREVLGGEKIMPRLEPGSEISATYNASEVWTDVPDKYRTKLTIELKRIYQPTTHIADPETFDLVGVSLFADEVYGQKLQFETNDFEKIDAEFDISAVDYPWCPSNVLSVDALFENGPVSSGGGSAVEDIYVHEVKLKVGGSVLGTYLSRCHPIHRYNFHVGLSIDHPYPANSGAYLDRSFLQQIDLVTDAYVFLTFGKSAERSKELFVRGLGLDRPLAYAIDETRACPGECEPPDAVDGGIRRSDLSKPRAVATWVHQASMLLDVLGEVSKSKVTHHASIGIAYSRSTVWAGVEVEAPTGGGEYSVADEAIGLSALSSVSIQTNTNAAYSVSSIARTGALTMAALEGSAIQQISGAPYSGNIPTRFEWANRDLKNLAHSTGGAAQDGQDPHGAVPFGFYSDTVSGGVVGFMGGNICQYDNGCSAAAMQAAMQEYIEEGFQVVAARDAYLGPGYRCGISFVYAQVAGILVPNANGGVGGGVYSLRSCSVNSSRGGAFIAFKPDFSEIAHIQVNALNTSKGGGSAGADPRAMAEFDFPEAADFQSQKEARAWSHSVDPRSGSLTFATGPLLTTGSGEFPQSLSFERSLITGERGFDEEIWHHNWDISADISSDGSIALGRGRAVFIAPTFIALHAMLEGFESGGQTPDALLRQEVSAAFIGKWWLDHLVQNVAIVRHGPQTTSYPRRLQDLEYVSPSGGTAKIVQTGEAVYGVPNAVGVGGGVQRVDVFRYENVDLDLHMEDGSIIDFGYWSANEKETYQEFNKKAGEIYGFHAKSWDMPTGVSIDFEYEQQNNCWMTSVLTDGEYECHKPKIKRVSNTYGRSLTFTPSEGKQENPTSVTDDTGRVLSLEDEKVIFPDGTEQQYTLQKLYKNVPRLPKFGYLDQDYLTGTITVPTAVLLTEFREHGRSDPSLSIDYAGREVSSITDAVGVSVDYLWSAGRSFATRNAVGVTSRQLMDEDGNPFVSVNPNGSYSIIEFNGAGAAVRTRMFDDENKAVPQRFAESSTEFDALGNTLVERSLRVPYDRPTVNAAYDEIVQRYAYEDTTWPTKPTKIYQPRFELDADPDRMAKQIYYDQQTGLPELEYDASYYCARDIPERDTVKVFPVERSGGPVSVAIEDFTRCRAMAYEYDALGRPVKTYKSQYLGYFDSQHRNWREAAWVESIFDYYAIGDMQKGALKSAWTGEEGEIIRRRADFDWDAVGNLISVKNELGHGATAEYDAMRRVEKMFGAEGEESVYAYDPEGKLKAISQKIGEADWAVTRANYYADGSVHEVIDPNNDITTYSYDAAGRIDIVTDAEGRKTKTLYYPDGQTKCTIKAFGNVALQQAYVTYEYGPDGQVARQRPAKGSNAQTCDLVDPKYDTVYTYDEYRRLHETTFPKVAADVGEVYASGSQLGSDHTYVRQWFDQSGNIFQTRTRENKLIKTNFDVNNRPWRKDTEENRYLFNGVGWDGLVTWAQVYPNLNGPGEAPAYDILNRRVSIVDYDSVGQRFYERYFDGYGEMRSPQNPITRYYYDAVGNVDQLTFWNTATAHFTYDNSDRLKTATFGVNGGGQRPVATLTYDSMGRRENLFLGDYNVFHADGSPKFGFQNYSWDADSDLKKLTARWSWPNVPGHGYLGYLYDQDGSGLIIKAYAQHAAWRKGPTQNQVSNFTAANELDQYGNQTIDGVTYSFDYDGDGNMESDGVNTYTYNSENQLTRATGPLVNGNPIFDMEYRYDARGRRSHSIDHLNTNPDGTPSEVLHLHSGEMEVGDFAVTRDAVGKAINYERLTHIVPGAGIDERLAWHVVTGDELYFPMVNHQGSAVVVMDEDARLETSLTYDAYGNDLSGVSPGAYPYRYTGRRFDAQTGLYYYRARYYDPKIGRFLQTDPIGYEDQMNLYAYVGNSPYHWIDPSGESRNGNNGRNNNGRPGMGHNNPPPEPGTPRARIAQAQETIKANDPLNEMGNPIIFGRIPNAKTITKFESQAQASEQYGQLRDIIFSQAETVDGPSTAQFITLTREEFDRMAREWTAGEGQRRTSKDHGWVNTETGRSARDPSEKPTTIREGLWANFQLTGPNGFQSNVHVQIHGGFRRFDSQTLENFRGEK